MSAKWRLLKPFGIQPNKLTISLINQPLITTDFIEICIDEMIKNGLIGSRWSGYLIRNLQRALKNNSITTSEMATTSATPFEKLSLGSQMISAYFGPLSELPNGDRQAAIALVRRKKYYLEV